MGQKRDCGTGRAEQTLRDIRRATRWKFSEEEKICIVLEGLRGEDTIAELCRVIAERCFASTKALRRTFITDGRRTSLKPARSGFPGMLCEKPRPMKPRTSDRKRAN